MRKSQNNINSSNNKISTRDKIMKKIRAAALAALAIWAWDAIANDKSNDIKQLSSADSTQEEVLGSINYTKIASNNSLTWLLEELWNELWISEDISTFSNRSIIYKEILWLWNSYSGTYEQNISLLNNLQSELILNWSDISWNLLNNFSNFEVWFDDGKDRVQQDLPESNGDYENIASNNSLTWLLEELWNKLWISEDISTFSNRSIIYKEILWLWNSYSGTYEQNIELLSQISSNLKNNSDNFVNDIINKFELTDTSVSDSSYETWDNLVDDNNYDSYSWDSRTSNEFEQDNYDEADINVRPSQSWDVSWDITYWDFYSNFRVSPENPERSEANVWYESDEWNWDLEVWVSAMNMAQNTFEVVSLNFRNLINENAWIYVEIDKSFSEDFQRILGWVVVQTMDDRVKINLTAQNLKRPDRLSHWWETYEFTGTRNTVWTSVDYSWIDNNFIDALWLAVVYSKTDDEYLWSVRTLSEQTEEFFRQWEEHLYFEWAESWDFQAYQEFSVNDRFRWRVWAGYVTREYNLSGETESWFSADAELDYLINDRTYWSVWFRTDPVFNRASVWVNYIPHPWWEISFDVQHDMHSASWRENDTSAMLTYTYNFGSSRDSYSNMFDNITQEQELRREDLRPVSWVDSKNLEWQKYIEEENTIFILMDQLEWDSYIETDEDGLFLSLNLDTWTNNIVSVEQVNISDHSEYFSVRDWQFLKITNFDKLDAPQTYDVIMLDSNWTYTLLTFETESWSVEFRATPQTLNSVPESVAIAFVNWDLHPMVRKWLLTWELEIQTVLKIVDWTIPQETVDKFISWEISAEELNQIAEVIDVNKDNLEEIISTIDSMDADDWTPKTWENLLIVLEEAKKVFEDNFATQEEVDQAVANLQEAKKSLIERADFWELINTIDKAKNLEKDNYTQDSWADLQTALNHAKDVLEDKNSTQNEVDEAVDILQWAINDLEKISDIPNDFNFTDLDDVEPNEEYVSDEIEIEWINVEVPISVEWWEYSINWWAWTSEAWEVENWDKVRVRHTSSWDYETTVTTVLDINWVIWEFSTTTKQEVLDEPDEFNIPDILDQEPDTEVTTESITVSWINVPVEADTTHWVLVVNWNVQWNTAEVNEWDEVSVRLTTPDWFGDSMNVTLTIWEWANNESTFSVETREAEAPTLELEDADWLEWEAFNYDINDFITKWDGDIDSYEKISWNLPDWLNLDTSTWIISGTPTEDGTFSITIRITDEFGNEVEDSFSISIEEKEEEIEKPKDAPDNLSSADEWLTNNDNPEISWESVDYADSYEYRIKYEGGEVQWWTDIWNNLSTSVNLNEWDGDYEIEVRWVNDSGEGPSSSIEFELDTVWPEVDSFTEEGKTLTWWDTFASNAEIEFNKEIDEVLEIKVMWHDWFGSGVTELASYDPNNLTITNDIVNIWWLTIPNEETSAFIKIRVRDNAWNERTIDDPFELNFSIE